ncbi:hypothetical protein HanXRQr2_Chr07g0302431 [Helianthus annuus]|uniref:Uncharacterized protein n=1 Tax=Helianthus annuus TaxID=4232 RepID=A0A9K3NG77_HELAN|nr:hypothetical protein HanXRQr2_Chr07g0302431 [Helianthus annuus]
MFGLTYFQLFQKSLWKNFAKDFCLQKESQTPSKVLFSSTKGTPNTLREWKLGFLSENEINKGC